MSTASGGVTFLTVRPLVRRTLLSVLLSGELEQIAHAAALPLAEDRPLCRRRHREGGELRLPVTGVARPRGPTAKAHGKAATTVSIGRNKVRLSAGYSMNSAHAK